MKLYSVQAKKVKIFEFEIVVCTCIQFLMGIQIPFDRIVHRMEIQNAIEETNN